MSQRNVPAKALRFTVGAFEFGDNGPDAKTAPIHMVARSGQPIDHWFWGKVVHDMAGMTLHKPRVPVDYAHNSGEVLGYLNHFDTSTSDLCVSGAIVPFRPDDRASEVLHKSRAGVPYEASINFGGDGIELEEVDKNTKVQVNGFEFEGPGIVVRKWPLRGVAVCPYGADANTASELSEGGEISVTCFSAKEKQMSETKPVEAAHGATVEAGAGAEGGKPVDAAATELQAKPSAEAAKTATVETAPAVVVLSDGQKFLDAFGPQGGVWFAQGKTFAEAQALQLADLKAQLAAKDTEIAELKTRLSAVPRGEGSPIPVEPSDAPQNPKRKELKQTTGDKLAQVIRLPGTMTAPEKAKE